MTEQWEQMGARIGNVPPNPFRPGMGLEPPYLADRQYQLQRFARFLDGFPEFPRNVRLTGLRGVGKTVLLQRYATLAEEHGWVVVRRELAAQLQDEPAFGLAFVDDCRHAVEHVSHPAAAKRQARTALRQALDLLGGLSVSLAGISISLKTSSAAQARQPLLEDQLCAAVETTCQAARSVGRRGLLLSYDEAHVVQDSTRLGRHPISALLGAIARAQRERVPVMLIVCGLPPLTENLARAKSYSERMFQAEVLDALQPPEDREAFVRPLAESHRQFDVDLAEAVRRDARGYPFHIQFYGALLWDAVPWPHPITRAGFDSVRPAMLAALDRAFFDARLARCSAFEKRLLNAMAVTGEAADHAVVVQRLGSSHDLVKNAISRLVSKGLVYRPERGRLAFSVPMFGEYLRRTGNADG
jgi:hypothetical protein